VELLNLGFDNAVVAARVISIIAVNSTPVRRMIETAENAGRLIDATHGKKVKSVVITDSGHYIISAIQPETLAARAEVLKQGQEKKPVKEPVKEKPKEPDKK